VYSEGAIVSSPAFVEFKCGGGAAAAAAAVALTMIDLVIHCMSGLLSVVFLSAVAAEVVRTGVRVPPGVFLPHVASVQCRVFVLPRQGGCRSSPKCSTLSAVKQATRWPNLGCIFTREIQGTLVDWSGACQ
jgi:hypothetical protein